MKKTCQLIPFIVLLSFLFTALSFSIAYSEELNEKAPDFTLKSNKGKNLKLSEFRGDVVMINFWASWCAPCRQEMPVLNQLYARYKPMGFTLLGVNVEEDSNQAKTLLKEIRIDFPILFDTENKVSQLFDVTAMPSTIVIDRSGNKRFIHRSYLPGDEKDYDQYIRTLVRE